jgi:hypothetical protein
MPLEVAIGVEPGRLEPGEPCLLRGTPEYWPAPPISQEELRAAFNPGNGWIVAAIELDRVQTRYQNDGAPAWLATIKRI